METMLPLTEYQKSVLLGCITPVRIEGEALTRRVWIDGVELLPNRSQALRNHSPDGFNWGYEGSGAAQLALGILLEILNDNELATRFYQDFKRHFVAAIPFKEKFSHDIILANYFETVIKIDGL